MDAAASIEGAELRVAKKFRLTKKIGQGSFGDIFLGISLF